MYGFICKRVLYSQPQFDLGFVGNARIVLPIWNNSFSSRVAVIEENKKLSKEKKESFKVSYLIDSCGLSPETVKSVSKKVQFGTPERPDSVLNVLRKYGFTDAHISKLVKKRPQLLLSNVEKSILPKLEFFSSVGATSADIASTISTNPVILERSLENHLIPSFNFLKSMFLTNENVIKALKCNAWIFLVDINKSVAPNIEALRKAGVPQAIFQHIVSRFANVLIQSQEKFDKNLKVIRKMGFPPSKTGFIVAMHVLASVSEFIREQKMDVLRKWGWSEDEIKLAFRKCPHFMVVSEVKLISKMDFFVNKMGWPPAVIASYPMMLVLSLEKRILPRCLVIKALLEKGLITKYFNKYTFLSLSEKKFLDKFVMSYLDFVPELLDIYQRKKGDHGLDGTDQS